MNLDFGVFALRQVLNSLVIVGPLLLITGLSFYLFKESSKSIRVYLVLGALCTVAGACSLVQDFKGERAAPRLVEPAHK